MDTGSGHSDFTQDQEEQDKLNGYLNALDAQPRRFADAIDYVRILNEMYVEALEKSSSDAADVQCISAKPTQWNNSHAQVIEAVFHVDTFQITCALWPSSYTVLSVLTGDGALLDFASDTIRRHFFPIWRAEPESVYLWYLLAVIKLTKPKGICEHCLSPDVLGCSHLERARKDVGEIV